MLPAFGLVYLVAAPTPLRRRIWQLLGRRRGAARRRPAGGSRSSSSWPASCRPYIGGSQHNSDPRADLRLQRLRPADRQRDRQRRRRRRAGGGMWGATGWRGCSTPSSAARSRGCCPAALILLVAGLCGRRGGRRAPTATRAALRAVGRLAARDRARRSASWPGHHPRVLHGRPGAGDRRARRHRRGACCGSAARQLAPASVLAVTVAVTAVWAYVLLGRSADCLPWLRRLVLVGGMLARRGCCWPALLGRAARGRRWPRPALAAVAGRRPRRTRSSTAATPHTGAIPTAGPAVAGGRWAGRAADPGGGPAAFGGGPGGRGGRRARRAGPGRRRHGRRSGGGGGRPAQRQRPPSAELTALLEQDADALHLGRRDRRRQPAPPATSSPPASR